MRSAFALFIALFFASCAQLQTQTTPAPKYKLIAYAMGRTDFSRISAEKLTHINYSFGLVNTNGQVYLRPNAPAHLAQLHALKARNPNLKIVLSIGGWGADNFSDAALTADSRAKFARSCVDLVKRYALDGLDLDWEYPGQPGPGIKYRAEDKTNFTAMLRELRAQLDALSDERKRNGHDRYVLTIATAGGTNYFKNTEMEEVHRHLDWINIMTYDFYGAGSPAGHHAGLYNPTGGTARRTTQSDVEDHLRVGIPPSKLVIGAAFYGKLWTNVASLNPPTGGKHVRGYSYVQLSTNVLGKDGFERRWDPDAKAAYLWNESARSFISYEDPEALKAKCNFVKKEKLGGIMYWEYSNDADEQLLDVLRGELNKPAK